MPKKLCFMRKLTLLFLLSAEHMTVCNQVLHLWFSLLSVWELHGDHSASILHLHVYACLCVLLRVVFFFLWLAPTIEKINMKILFYNQIQKLAITSKKVVEFYCISVLSVTKFIIGERFFIHIIPNDLIGYCYFPSAILEKMR